MNILKDMNRGARKSPLHFGNPPQCADFRQSPAIATTGAAVAAADVAEFSFFFYGFNC